MPKRCGHLDGKSLISAAEMAGKIRAACDARASDETLIIARTDAHRGRRLRGRARPRRGLSGGRRRRAVRRGAAIGRGDRRAIVDRFAGRVPLMANMVEGGKHADRRRAGPGGARLQLRDLPGRHRARRRGDGARLLRQPGRKRLERRRSATACSTSPGSTRSSARLRCWPKAGATTRRTADGARSGYARDPQGPARADRRRDGRDAVPLRPSTRSSPRRTTPRTASTTPRPARRWCRASRACRSSSASWPSR